MRIFVSVEPKVNLVPISQYIIIFQRWQFFEPPSSIPAGDRHVRPITFCKKFNSEQFSFEQFFYIIGNFSTINI